MYARMGRPSIAPEKLLRALLVQVLYSVRSERLLMEELNYNMLFRCFVGLNMDDQRSIAGRDWLAYGHKFLGCRPRY
jgi:transposase